ncbi:hypothetical protein [Saccharolobus islandicus]|uniref:hypothetical protein n=1 Tax=Saccharolobus islandicus TaxID=43080 RepID=UPI00138952F4|nr:hypothetical protein [Sulfolobus islandicus]
MIRDYIWWAVKWLREPYHLDKVGRGTSLLSSNPFDERDTRCSPSVPLRWGGAPLASLRENRQRNI